MWSGTVAQCKGEKKKKSCLTEIKGPRLKDHTHTNNSTIVQSTIRFTKD